MKNLYSIAILLFTTAQVFALGDTTNIPLQRRSRHDDIRREQIACDKLDGKQDGLMATSSNDNNNSVASDVLFRIPNETRFWIETNDKLLPTNNDKVRFLKYTADILIAYRTYKKEFGTPNPDFAQLMQTFERVLKAKAVGLPIIPFIQSANYGVAKIINQVFAEGEEKTKGNAIVYLKYTKFHPDRILQTIAPYANQDYADSLIVQACKLNPVQFYNFAQSQTSIVGKLIKRNTDKMVMQVAALSRTENALFYFPFLDDLLSEKQTIADIKKYVGDGVVGYDSIGYYKLLVKTAIGYSKRMNAPFFDTAIAYYGANGLLKTLRSKGLQHFITPINALHEVSNSAIRFKAIQPLAPIDLYYMIIEGENDIYTSSYKYSFARLLQLMGTTPRGDSLLLAVNFDGFRKFIKMAANYNKLDTFLKTMPNIRSEQIMKAFVNLDNSNLEDAVDVADSYSSITDKKLQQSMLSTITENESNAVSTKNTKAIIIYGLLKTIFLSADDSTIDVAAKIGIPPIYDMANKAMQDDKGNIYEQVFFYGDADGKAFYPSFRNSFATKDWKVTDKKEWMEAVSAKGNVTVFANKPLDNDANLDDTAQVHLIKYMEAQGIKPAVVVHRGHSYWLERTMSRMPGDAKIVVLGSCGGYQNLNQILEINPAAHIISTKEIGTGDINRPILTYMNNVFASGNNLSWRGMWQNLTTTFSKDPSKAVRESWDDYIPPYKNLGAIFLKAYNKNMEAIN